MARAVQRLEVSLKAFIVNGDRVLFVKERDTGFWELPGGRIDVGEEHLAHADVLAREMAEELGAGVKIEFGDAAVSWTRAHPEGGQWVFLLARVGRLISGDPMLSPEHEALFWAARETWGELQFPPQSGYRDAIDRLWRAAQVR